ncbi:M15 family metallopeptidase [Chitinophaga solisilvae]|uniref:M15 family metallopeptidase n=1 Tax=Chitinophaga solisilvae TaxID=1233460 RepID=UPI001367BE46|nr:M15 family metallopeptidase [Chitinophaga solisilvae]
MPDSHLSRLIPEFRIKASVLLMRCSQRGVVMRPTEGLRDPLIQAAYWKRSRNAEEITAEITGLRSAGAPFLAECLEQVNPQEGPHATNAIPGLSWHQWGEALDCVWMAGSRPIWDATVLINNVNGYQIYGEEAKRLGLDCGLYWSGFTDAMHVQLRNISSPATIYSLQDIDRQMELSFRHQLEHYDGQLL